MKAVKSETSCALLVLFWPLIALVGGSRNSRLLVPQAEVDPTIRHLCKGPLGEYASCSCNEETKEVACINAQFVDTGAFQYVNDDDLSSLTFHGNNFQDLPDAPLLGDKRQLSMGILNISANYIVNLNSRALLSVPNIRQLDLSNNEIVLREQDVDFLTHTPKLTHLYMRRAFTSPLVNRTHQFDLLMSMFARADLRHLKVLDLSYNFWSSVPYNLPCPFPSLVKLDLRQNLLKILEVNASCLNESTIKTIDLSRNHIHRLEERFREFAERLPAGTLILRNSFHCDCESKAYIQWIRNTQVIHDKNVLTCARASPKAFVGERLVELPLEKLDCSIDLEATSASNVPFCTNLYLITTVLILLLLGQCRSSAEGRQGYSPRTSDQVYA